MVTKNGNKILFVVFFLLGDSPSPVFYVPTFWNTLSVCLFHLHGSCEQEEMKGKIGCYKFGQCMHSLII
jgi:hypothetical protein